jgi:hypothetical protein
LKTIAHICNTQMIHLQRYVWNTWNICSQHACICNIQIYFCNIQIKHLQHLSATNEIFGTYTLETYVYTETEPGGLAGAVPPKHSKFPLIPI